MGGASPSPGGWHGSRQRSPTIIVPAAVGGCNDNNKREWRCDGCNEDGGSGGSGWSEAAEGRRKKKMFPLASIAND